MGKLVVRLNLAVLCLLAFAGCGAPDASDASDASVDPYVRAWDGIVAAAPGGWTVSQDVDDPGEQDLYLITKADSECLGIAISAVTVDPRDPYANEPRADPDIIESLMMAVDFAPDRGSAAITDLQSRSLRLAYSGMCVNGPRGGATLRLVTSSPSSTGLSEALFVITADPSPDGSTGTLDPDATALADALIDSWAKSVE